MRQTDWSYTAGVEMGFYMGFYVLKTDVSSWRATVDLCDKTETQAVGSFHLMKHYKHIHVIQTVYSLIDQSPDGLNFIFSTFRRSTPILLATVYKSLGGGVVGVSIYRLMNIGIAMINRQDALISLNWYGKWIERIQILNNLANIRWLSHCAPTVSI